MVRFSIIIPVLNGEAFLDPCVESVTSQSGDGFSVEILIVDDGSTDNTPAQIERLSAQHGGQIKALATLETGGPGLARNEGLNHATGDWVLFLDSDDRLSHGALQSLGSHLSTNDRDDVDMVGFDWRYDERSSVDTGRAGGRYDAHSLLKNKTELLKDAISLGTDGSVIYTAIRRSLLNENGLRFSRGIHEDVDFIFKVYWFAGAVGYLDTPIYLKNNREGSIVNSVSKLHLDGYFRAYDEILDHVEAHGALTGDTLDVLGRSYLIGLIGVVATRARSICLSALPDDEVGELLEHLYRHWAASLERIEHVPIPELTTKYAVIARRFIEVMSDADGKADASSIRTLRAFLVDINKMSWSCYDLHHSLFLAPDEVRTCCKRFFVDGEMKGDVSLVRAVQDQPESISVEVLHQAKKDLYMDINRGTCEACSGCPFLEFKDWGYIDELKIEHLSMEYHSVCNMKCTYCSEEFYGGKQAMYDVENLVQSLIEGGQMGGLRSVVWGGGEPGIGKHFDAISTELANTYPQLKQRILTNCIKHSDTIGRLLEEDKANLLTSIDAGTKDTFIKVRKNKLFEQMWLNLKSYVGSKPHNVGLKYIFTDDNASVDEVRAFVDLVVEHELLECSVQISHDFKREHVEPSAAVSMILMYGLLTEAGCRLVYFDELLRQRLSGSEDDHAFIMREIGALSVQDTLAAADRYERVILFGAGQNSKLLLETTHFFRTVEVDHFVDSTPEKIGHLFMGREVRHPDTLHESTLPVLISAVQNSPLIYDRYLAMGLDEGRLIKGLVI